MTIGGGILNRRFGISGAGIGAYTTNYINEIIASGGSITPAEISYFNNFENSCTSLQYISRLPIFGVSNQINAKISFVNPTTTHITEVNNPAWSQYVGYTGASGAYLNSNWNPLTDSLYLQNDASIFVYIKNNTGDGAVYGTYNGSNTAGYFYPNRTGTTGLAYLNMSATAQVTNVVNNGFYYFRRNNSSNFDFYFNGVHQNTFTFTSGTIPNLLMFILAGSNFGNATNFYLGTVSAWGAGSSSVNPLNLYNSLQTLGTSLGWAV